MKIIVPIVLSLVATLIAISVTRLVAARDLRHDPLLTMEVPEPAMP